MARAKLGLSSGVRVRRHVGVLLAAAVVVFFGARAPVRAESPSTIDARLAAVLALGTDQRITTEGGGIRIIGFATSKARAVGAIFFIHGDPEWFRIGAFSTSLRDEETRVLANHLEWLQRLAARGRFATYFVARTGVFGSDGETSDFRREESYLAIGHAIDAVIKRDRIRAAAIAGHSGGAAVALYHAIDLPNPVARCYILASGVYNLAAMAAFMRDKGEQKGARRQSVVAVDRARQAAMAFQPLPREMSIKFKYYEPLFHLSEMAANPLREVVAVSNHRDRTAPYFASEDLVARLKALGHRARLIEGEARPPAYHYTYDAAIKAARACLDEAIGR